MKHSPFAQLILSALIACVVSAASVPCHAEEPGRAVFRTSDNPKFDGYGEFIVSYPSSFRKATAARVDSSEKTAQIMIASNDSYSERGAFIGLSAMIYTITPEYAEALDGPVSAIVWKRHIERFHGDDPGGSWSGVRPFVFKGLLAADFDETPMIKSDSGGEAKVFGVAANRAVVSGLHIFRATCLVGLIPENEASFNDFASREIPEVAEVCIPFFDSIEIR